MADRAAGGPIRHAGRARTVEEAWTAIAGIVNIRARKLIANQPIKREDVLMERLPLCASAESAVAQSEEPECRHLQC